MPISACVKAEKSGGSCQMTTASISLSPSRTILSTTRLAGLGLVVDYLEHGRTFPTGAPTPAHDQTCYGLSIFLGKVRPFTSPRRGPSTGSDHCSRLLDDPQIQQKIGAILRRSGLTRSTGINVPQRWYP